MQLCNLATLDFDTRNGFRVVARRLCGINHRTVLVVLDICSYANSRD